MFKVEVTAQSMTEAHATKARGWNLDVLELECLDHFDRVGCVETRRSEVEVEAVELV